MFRHLPASSKIFLALLVITLLLTYLALQLSLTRGGYGSYRMTRHQNVSMPHRMMSIADWQKYQDATYPLTFQFPPDWQVKSAVNTDKIYDISLIAPKESDNIHIYISQTGFKNSTNDMHKPIMVSKYKGEMYGQNLIEVRVGDYYYTFDATAVPQLQTKFSTILSTVAFR